MSETTMNQFFKLMRDEQDAFKRRILQVVFDMSTAVKREVINNIKETFGSESGRSAGTSGKGGKLMGSVQREMLHEGAVQITAGNEGVPYAAIHEFGGTIKAKKSFLTIPAEGYEKRRAREFDLKFRLVGRDKYNNPMGILTDDEDRIAFWLFKMVQIPARPYMQPAVEEVGTDEVLMERLKEVTGKAEIPYEVTRL